MKQLPDLEQIIQDLRLVARHVARQPRGYARFEADRARIVLRQVNVEALRATLRSAAFVSRFYAPLTPRERRVFDATLRLQMVISLIEERMPDIQAQLRAA